MFTRQSSEHCRVAGYLRRICDLTSPNLPRLDDGRERIRQNRTLPVLLAPWEDGVPVVAEAATALTKNISDYGVSITMSQPFRAAEAVLGIWLTEVQGYEPWFFRGPIRLNVPIGGGFWGLGIEVIERLEVTAGSQVAGLLTLAKELLPPRPVETSRPSDLLTGRPG